MMLVLYENAIKNCVNFSGKTSRNILVFVMLYVQCACLLLSIGNETKFFFCIFENIQLVEPKIVTANSQTKLGLCCDFHHVYVESHPIELHSKSCFAKVLNF